MLKGFREFISQGNVIDLAVGVIIGGAFQPIVKAVTKVIMDIIGQVVGQPNFNSVGQFRISAGADPIQPGTILTEVVNFLLIAAAVYFCIVLPMNKMRERKAKEKTDAPAEPTETEILGEIRDLLAAQRRA